jgi:2'-5' RNA ligase
LTDLAASETPLEVSVTGVGHTPDVFKTLFLELEHETRLLALQRRICQLLPLVDEYSFAPHLSLLYRELPAAERERLSSHASPPRAVLLDALVLVVPGSGGWRDVDGWREQLVCLLLGR